MTTSRGSGRLPDHRTALAQRLKKRSAHFVIRCPHHEAVRSHDTMAAVNNKGVVPPSSPVARLVSLSIDVRIKITRIKVQT